MAWSEKAVERIYFGTYNDIERNPDNWGLRLILADALIEDFPDEQIDGISCEVLGLGQRWQVEEKRHPWERCSPGENGWEWDDSSKQSFSAFDGRGRPSLSHVGVSMFCILLEHIPGGFRDDLISGGQVIRYASIISAEQAIAKAIDLHDRCRAVQDEFLELSKPRLQSGRVGEPFYLAGYVYPYNQKQSVVVLDHSEIVENIYPEREQWFREEIEKMKSRVR